MTHFVTQTSPPRRRLLGLPFAVAFGLGAAVAGPLTSPLHAQSACDDISGEYEVLVDVPGGGPTDVRLEIEQHECVVTGIVAAQTRTQIENGVVEGSTASFTFQASNQSDGSPLVIRWEITIDGDDVTGTFSHDLFGNIPVVGTRAGA